MYYLDLAFYYVMVTALVLTLVVFIHEAGHYLMARLFGVRIEAFSIGFGREIWGRTDRRGMRWKICLFPFGGYVVPYKEYPPLNHDRGQFERDVRNGALWTKSNSQRALIALAGPLANFAFALVLMTFVFILIGKQVANPVIGAVEVGAGADLAGIRVGDELIEINHQPVPEAFEEIVHLTQQAGDEMVIRLRRDGQGMEFNVPLRVMKKEGDFGEDDSRKVMGVILGSGLWKIEAINAVDGTDTKGKPDLVRKIMIERLGQDIIVNFGQIKKSGDEQKDYRLRLDRGSNQALFEPGHVNYESIFYGNIGAVRKKKLAPLDAAIESALFSWQGIRKTSGVLYQMVIGKKDTGDLGGVVKIGEMSGRAVRQSGIFGYDMFFRLLAVLSVNIGFLNLLPLPMLDGGHLAFNAYEAVRGKPPTQKVRAYILAGGAGLVFGFIWLVNMRDIIDMLF